MATAADSVKTMARGAFPHLGAKVGIIENSINMATANAELVAQGDGEFAANDVIQALSLPKGCVVLSAGMEVTTAIGGVSALTLNLGTGDLVDQWAAAFDAGAASAGDYSANNGAAAGDGIVKILTAADTIDIEIASVTGTGCTGVVRVWALVADGDGLAG